MQRPPGGRDVSIEDSAGDHLAGRARASVGHHRRVLGVAIRCGPPGGLPLDSSARDAADLTRTAFERADTVTALCDMVSFRICLEEPTSFTQIVWTETGHVEIAVTIDDKSHVTLAPWPLSVPELSTVVVAYEAGGYPGQREPVLKRVVVSR